MHARGMRLCARARRDLACNVALGYDMATSGHRPLALAVGDMCRQVHIECPAHLGLVFTVVRNVNRRLNSCVPVDRTVASVACVIVAVDVLEARVVEAGLSSHVPRRPQNGRCLQNSFSVKLPAQSESHGRQR